MGELVAQEKREWTGTTCEPAELLLSKCALRCWWWVCPSSCQRPTGEGLAHSDSQGTNSGSQKTNEN